MVASHKINTGVII